MWLYCETELLNLSPQRISSFLDSLRKVVKVETREGMERIAPLSLYRCRVDSGRLPLASASMAFFDLTQQT